MTSIEISPDTSVHPLIAALRQRARRLKYIATIYLGFILIALVSGGFLFYWLPQLLIGQEQKLIPLQNLSIEKGALEASIKFISSRWESQKGNAIADVTRKGSRITKIEFTSVHSVHFVTTQNGWAVGPRGTILSTTDGGKSWQNQASGTDNHLRSVHFVTAKNGWAVGLNGTIMSTIDGGKSWQSQTSGTDDNLYSVHFVTAQNGWAVGGGWNDSEHN